jgi:hypothetical protein
VAIEPLRHCDLSGIRGLDGDRLWDGAFGNRLAAGGDFLDLSDCAG